MKKLTKKAMALVLSVMMLVVFMPTSTFAADATSGDQQSDQQNQVESTTPPVAEKKLTPNGNGTYDISLSVTGKSESSSESSKADVVVVMDVSGSMDEDTSSYVENATGRYGLVNGKYVNLYSKNQWGGWWDDYSEIDDDSTTGTVYYRNGQNYFEYKGDRYSQTRLAVAKKSIGDLAKQLLSNNDASNPDKVTMSLVTFSNGAKIEVDKRTKLTDFQGELNGLSADGGTNWEAALQEAGKIEARDGAAKYVIFVSDGNPTYYKGGGSGYEYNNNVATCYEHAKDDAKALVDAGWQFYGVGVFGNVDRMQALVNYAYGDSPGTATGKYFSASDQTQLMAAFSNIINSITQNFAYSSVVIKDGLTGMVSCGIEGKTGGFTYTRSGGSFGEGQIWSGAPDATLSETDKQVVWNLGDTPLENGVKYTVSFTVWPSQEAYDLVANLKNGVIKYGDLTDDQKAQIVPMTDGGYGLKTNTAASVEYTQIETKTTATEPEGYVSGQPAADGYTYTYDKETRIYTGTKSTKGSAPISNPDPIPLTATAINVYKVWDGGEGTGDVQLKLMKDGKYAGKIVTLNQDNKDNNENNRWITQVHVAPGLIVDGEILEAGHDYTLVEVDGGYKYEFTSTTCHPMLINSATGIKIADVNADENADDVSPCVLIGTNTKKSNLEITKTLAGNNNTADNTLFTYKVTVTENNGDDVWFSIGDGQNVINVDNRVTGATAEETDGVKTGYYSAASGSEITVKIKAGENIFFTNLAKGSTYSVEEVDIPGEYQLQKVVVNQGTEQTNAKAEGTISENKKTYTVAYTNKLLTPTNVTLQATKKVEGKDAKEAFTFSMKLASGDRTGVVMPSNKTATTPANMQKGQSETVNFNSIKFTKPGTYTFKVKETNETVPAGWSYDKTEKTITVVVSANDGALSARVEGNNPEIVNSYSANAATLSSIPVKKELTGQGAQSFDIRNAFTFTLAAEGNAPLPQTTVIKNPDANGGTAEFGPITYTAAGTYNYTVTESGSVDGIENDPVSSKSVTVTVTDNDEGQLVANITQGADLTFTNKVIEPVEVVLHATKKVEGRDAAEAFTFSIRQTNTNAEGADGVVMPETVTATTPANMQKGQSEKVNFNSIKFTKPGTYTFKVKETNETVPAGWSYDKTERTITVVVSKTNGVLSATVQNDNPTFTNKYSASPVNNFSIPVTKQLEGTGAPDITGKYTFTLTGKNGAPMPADTQKTNPTDGRIEFGPITYNSAGEYEYTVSETGTVAHITNDSNATKNITVVVEDNGKGQLVASFKEGNGVTFTNTYAPEPTKANISVEKILEGTGAPGIKDKYTFTLAAKDNAPMPNNSTELKNPDSDGGTVTFGDITYTEAGTYKYTVTESGDVPGITNDSNATKEVVVVVTDNKGQLEAVVNSGDTLTFTNTYAPTATSATLEVEKVLKNMELQENQFTFQLLDSQGESIQEKQNAADGTVKFDTIDYTVPGEYNYTIKEVIPEDAKKAKGVTYDDHEVKVKVTVADTNGVLEATVEFTGNTTFTNTYNASGKSGIVGLKTLEGKTLEAGQFTFNIEGKDGAPMPEKTEAKNDANGYVNFGEIDFELADLGIAEEDKSDENGSDGATEGESTEQGGTSEEGGSSEPAAAVATSTDEGANDEPSDENKNEDAAVPRTKTFTYTVTEVAGNEPGITYNTTPQEFTITVTDDGQGGLTVTTNPPTDKPNAPLFTIKNTYTPAKANIGVTKNFVDGRTDLGLSAWDECADAEFEFELKAVGDAPLNPVDSGSAATTVKVTKASTSASFGMYEFDSPGKYEYTITEKNSGIKDVVYDATSHKVTVEVKEDSTTHQLSAEVKYDNNEESLVVTNTLKPAENAKLNVVKHVVNTNGQPLSVDGVFHVALFSDKNLTHRVSAVNELVFDGSKPTAEAEFKVTAGKKYYVAETDADGKPLSGAQLFGEGEDAASYSICFGDPADYDNVIDYPQSAAAEIPESGSADDVEFSNIFDGAKFMVLGSISIDKEVKIGKETKNVDGSFYVTAEYSQENSDELEKRTVELKVKNGKTEQPATISNLPTNTDITLKETDANGNVLENSVYNPIFTYGDESGKTLKVKLTEDDSDINVKLENSEKLIDVAFDLTWDDYGNRDNTRDEYEVTLFANGVEVEGSTKVFSPDVTEGDDCKWTDLRQYDDEENEIVYSVKQTKVPDQYSSNTDGTDVGLCPDEDGIVHLIDTYRAVKITKKVTDSTGKAIKYNGDFYVTMFADPDCKEIVKDPVKITLDNEKSKTVIIPVPANSLYYLAETDADGNKVDSSFEFIPTFSSTVAEASDDETSIVLTNQAKAGTPADDPDNDTDAKTGDSANLMLMLLALLTSMLIGAVVLIRGRRREN